MAEHIEPAVHFVLDIADPASVVFLAHVQLVAALLADVQLALVPVYRSLVV